MPAPDRPAIVCLAHLDWDYVWQRPQQILSRLARHYPVTYIQEPRISPAWDGQPRFARVAADGGVTAWQPFFPDRPEVIGPWRAVYAGLVRELLIEQGWIRRAGGGLVATRPLILWFYTPIPWYVVDRLPADLVVYDVMDELADFKGAAPDLREREARLLSHADLVFAGGRSLHEARQGRHPHLHLFPSGVDAAHFGRAGEPGAVVAPEVAALPRPRLGYHGVIDERIDLALLADLAGGHPDWSIALVGPVAKIEPRLLPRAPNLHYLGPQPYGRLPEFLAGFDVCLMPFARNEATRAISPTKTLEYMAGGKPIVSTPVPDVVANWAEVVRIAETAAGFAEAVRRALGETAAERAARAGRAGAIVAGGGWDGIAGGMRALIDDALARRAATGG